MTEEFKPPTADEVLALARAYLQDHSQTRLAIQVAGPIVRDPNALRAYLDGAENTENWRRAAKAALDGVAAADERAERYRAETSWYKESAGYWRNSAGQARAGVEFFSEFALQLSHDGHEGLMEACPFDPCKTLLEHRAALADTEGPSDG